jgi:hypothetical protein
LPSRRFDWHQHITEVWREYRSARAAVDRLKTALAATPDLLKNDPVARQYLRDAQANLEGTYTPAAAEYRRQHKFFIDGIGSVRKMRIPVRDRPELYFVGVAAGDTTMVMGFDGMMPRRLLPRGFCGSRWAK